MKFHNAVYHIVNKIYSKSNHPRENILWIIWCVLSSCICSFSSQRPSRILENETVLCCMICFPILEHALNLYYLCVWHSLKSHFFYHLAYFCYYLYISLYFLILFMSFIVLFQLSFSFIYCIFSKKFLVSAK